MSDTHPRYRTGRPELDDQIAATVDAIGDHPDRNLLFEMVVSATRLGLEGADRGELKLLNAALKELRYSFEVFGPYRDIRKVSIFGSARTQPDQPEYIAAREFGAAMVEKGWMAITGAGPGIMTAGIEGAGAENSFGVNILLPFESEASGPIADDPKLINFKYFFTRKLMFMKESHGYALFPGGFGTMDEAFELLTLMQTGRTYLAPVALVDPPGSSYWDTWLHFVERELCDAGLVSAADLSLVQLTGDVEDAVDTLCDFYRNYHSMRFVGGRLVLRLQHALDADHVASLNSEFSGILADGRIESIEATAAEIADDDVPELPRLAMAFDRRSYGRLRELVDRLNEMG